MGAIMRTRNRFLVQSWFGIESSDSFLAQSERHSADTSHHDDELCAICWLTAGAKLSTYAARHFFFRLLPQFSAIAYFGGDDCLIRWLVARRGLLILSSIVLLPSKQA